MKKSTLINSALIILPIIIAIFLFVGTDESSIRITILALLIFGLIGQGYLRKNKGLNDQSLDNQDK